jgi:hypothetical protein
VKRCILAGLLNTEMQSGVIQIDDLPAPEPGRNYQLWIVDPNFAEPISAGLDSQPHFTLSGSH